MSRGFALFLSNFFNSLSFLGLGSHLSLLLRVFFVDFFQGNFDFQLAELVLLFPLFVDHAVEREKHLLSFLVLAFFPED